MIYDDFMVKNRVFPAAARAFPPSEPRRLPRPAEWPPRSASREPPTFLERHSIIFNMPRKWWWINGFQWISMWLIEWLLNGYWMVIEWLLNGYCGSTSLLIWRSFQDLRRSSKIFASGWPSAPSASTSRAYRFSSRWKTLKGCTARANSKRSKASKGLGKD